MGLNPTHREDLTVAKERAILVGVLLPHTNVDPRDPLAELAALAESAGAEVMTSTVQKRLRPHPGHGIGKGKVQEVLELAEAHDASVIMFDNDLSPKQIRNLERLLQRKILDRSELILDIFASRARSHEARLQVELAQLEYTAPRLRGMWTHLERIAGAGGGKGAGAVGGIGTRGPGEKQIEIDRRIVKDRISHLKREIEKIDDRKVREIRTRENEFTVSLVGYTNSGKTTLLNRLTGENRFVKDMLFATLDTKTARWNLGDGAAVLLSDTVGFVRDLPHHLVASFRATLEEAIHADLLLHVVDAFSPFMFQQILAVNEVLKELGCFDHPTILLLNKMDAVKDEGLVELIELRSQESCRISALTGAGLDELARRVRERMKGKVARMLLTIPARLGKALAEVERLANVRSREYDNGSALLDVVMNRNQLLQLIGRHPAIRHQEIADGPAT